MFRRAFGWYAGMLESRPLVTKGVTSAALMGAGDVFAQKGTGKAERERERERERKHMHGSGSSTHMQGCSGGGQR